MNSNNQFRVGESCEQIVILSPPTAEDRLSISEALMFAAKIVSIADPSLAEWNKILDGVLYGD